LGHIRAAAYFLIGEIFLQKLIFIFILVFSGLSYGQTHRSTMKLTKKPRTHGKSYYQWGVHILLSQEEVAATRAGVTEKLVTQFQGISMKLTKRIPTSHIRWQWSHSADLAMGILHTRGAATSVVPDTLRNQPWYAATLNPGFIYRTTSVSEIGMGIPLTYRMIRWSLNDPTLTMDKKSSFSYGVSAIYINRLTQNSSLEASFTHQINWNSTIWSLGWNHIF
jgi:hypothetical protein